MYERTTQKPHALTRKQSGQVIPLRPLPGAPHKTPVTHPPFAAPAVREITDTTLHAIQNCLQTAGLGFDLLQLAASADAPDYEPMRQSVERAGRWILELREYCCPPTLHLSTENLAGVVEDAAQGVACEWERSGRATRIIAHAPCAAFHLDWRQIGKALERTVSGAYAMLPTEGGEVLIESGVRVIGAQQFIDLRVRSHGVVPLAIEEDAVFRPFALINGHQLGLGLTLAQRTAGRLHGQLFFHKISARQGCFTLLFRA